MRFEKPEYAKQRLLACERGCGDIEDGGDSPSYCIPADGVHCEGCQWDEERGVCFRNDCDALFTPPDLRMAQRGWPTDERPQLVITAGPERSGSTWLFNAVRLLFQHARRPLDSYWLKDVTDAALDARGVGKPFSHSVLVKTHAWSDKFDLGRATHTFVTHRDLRGVLASFRRMTWEYELPGNYVEDFFRWRDVAELDIAFEDIISRPEALLRDLAARLGLHGVDISAVLKDVSSLPVPKDWVDPVTQVWPNHISEQFVEARKRAAAAPGGAGGAGGGAGGAESLEAAMGAGLEPLSPGVRAQLDREAADRLGERFPRFFQLYGYT